jgi:hypothetical protein
VAWDVNMFVNISVPGLCRGTSQCGKSIGSCQAANLIKTKSKSVFKAEKKSFSFAGGNTLISLSWS